MPYRYRDVHLPTDLPRAFTQKDEPDTKKIAKDVLTPATLQLGQKIGLIHDVEAKLDELKERTNYPEGLMEVGYSIAMNLGKLETKDLAKLAGTYSGELPKQDAETVTFTTFFHDYPKDLVEFFQALAADLCNLIYDHGSILWQRIAEGIQTKPPIDLFGASGIAHCPWDKSQEHFEKPTTIKLINEIVDPPRTNGLVITQFRAKEGCALWHPVFTLHELYQKKRNEKQPMPRADMSQPDEVSTSVLVEENRCFFPVDMLRGFRGVCVSNTMLRDDEHRRGGRKRRKKHDSRIAVAVAGTVTMPFFGDDLIVPGDMVAFALIFSSVYKKYHRQAHNLRVLRGTQDRDSPQYVPRICKFTETLHVYDNHFVDACSAPFGICVGIEPTKNEITVLLRMDLYHSYAYPATKDDTADTFLLDILPDTSRGSAGDVVPIGRWGSGVGPVAAAL